MIEPSLQPFITRKEAKAKVLSDPIGTLELVFEQVDETVRELKKIIDRQRADVAYECDNMLDELVGIEAEK